MSTHVGSGQRVSPVTPSPSWCKSLIRLLIRVADVCACDSAPSGIKDLTQLPKRTIARVPAAAVIPKLHWLSSRCTRSSLSPETPRVGPQPAASDPVQLAEVNTRGEASGLVFFASPLRPLGMTFEMPLQQYHSPKRGGRAVCKRWRNRVRTLSAIRDLASRICISGA